MMRPTPQSIPISALQKEAGAQDLVRSEKMRPYLELLKAHIGGPVSYTHLPASTPCSTSSAFSAWTCCSSRARSCPPCCPSSARNRNRRGPKSGPSMPAAIRKPTEKGSSPDDVRS